MGKRVKWCDLPEELCSAIGKSAKSPIDVLRLRSICKSWRSSVTPSSDDPALSRPTIMGPSGKSFVAQTTIYRLELCDQTQNSPSMSSPKGWFIKIEESKYGQFRLLNPLTHVRRNYESDTSINLMNLRVVELTKAYSLIFECAENYLVHCRVSTKMVLFPNFTSTDVEDCKVFAICEEGKLGFTKFGDENWSLVDIENFYYDDIMLHEGQLYVVDELGTISRIDPSSLKVVQESPPLCVSGDEKHLVESNGRLYLVDLYIETENGPEIVDIDDELEGPDWPDIMTITMEDFNRKVIDIKVYKLDEEWERWMDVEELGGNVFVLGKDCNISLSAKEFCGCEGNSIYFPNKGRSYQFSLATSEFKRSKIFWPSPTLFDLEVNARTQ